MSKTIPRNSGLAPPPEPATEEAAAIGLRLSLVFPTLELETEARPTAIERRQLARRIQGSSDYAKTRCVVKPRSVVRMLNGYPTEFPGMPTQD